MKLVLPLLVLFVIVGLSRRSVRWSEVVMLIGAIVMVSAVYLVAWTP